MMLFGIGPTNPIPGKCSSMTRPWGLHTTPCQLQALDEVVFQRPRRLDLSAERAVASVGLASAGAAVGRRETVRVRVRRRRRGRSLVDFIIGRIFVKERRKWEKWDLVNSRKKR